MWDVLTVTEGGGMAPVACLAEDAPACGRRGECRTIAMWEGYRRLTEDYFRGISLADLMRTEDGGSYVI